MVRFHVLLGRRSVVCLVSRLVMLPSAYPCFPLCVNRVSRCNGLNWREFIAASRRRAPRWHRLFAFIKADEALGKWLCWGSVAGQIFKTSAAAALAVGTTSLLLIYFIPAPPSTVTMATGFQGSSFKYVGLRFRAAPGKGAPDKCPLQTRSARSGRAILTTG